MATRKVIARWWRHARHEHAWSGVRLWVDLYRDWKAAHLREQRRERDRATAKRGGNYASGPKNSDYMAHQLAGLQQAQSTIFGGLSQQQSGYSLYENLLISGIHAPLSQRPVRGWPFG